MKKTILVSVDRGETRVAVLEAKGTPTRLQRSDSKKKRKRGGAPPGREDGWSVAELYVERRGRRSIVGNIYKGKVDNVLPGMEAAFVDIGLERNGFLHVDEIVLPGGQQVPKRGRGSGRRINELIKPGQELVVQVVKDPLKSKGARLSMNLSVAGRYLVYMPQGEGVGVSRRLPDSERTRLRRMVEKIHGERRDGMIIRTAAHGARKADFEREVEYLDRLNEVLERRVGETQAPGLVFQEADLSVRVLRDVFLSDFEQAVIDDGKQHERVTSFLQRTAPELVDYVEHYQSGDLFEAWGVDREVRSTLSRRVDLPSGGYLMIDYAEALTVIDINTGSFTGRGGRLEDTITKVNVEAAEQVVRQLRLRDIGGIIVIDFIDMARSRNRDQVLKTLRRELERDRTKTYVMEISPLGLVEMTRQNVTDGVREILTKTCPTCDGEGVVESEETVAIDILRRLPSVVESDPRPEAYLLRVHPKVAGELVDEESGLLELEQQLDKAFLFEGGEALALDTFEVVESGPLAELEKRALPFREGEEVLVKLEEPHMYNPDDAIAKVDGYVVSVAGGQPHVGTRKLVRIESVSRSSATAALLGGAPEGDGEEEGEDEERVESAAARRRRRRGRRGGRGRPRAKTGSDGGD